MSKKAKTKVDKVVDLTFDGELTISRVAELKTRLVAALDHSDGLVIDLREAGRADLTFLQLLCSAHRTARKIGKFIRLSDVSEEIDTAVNAAGFLRNNMACGQDCADSCLWMER